MFCQNCGNELVKEAKFCQSCGQKVLGQESHEMKQMPKINKSSTKIPSSILWLLLCSSVAIYIVANSSLSSTDSEYLSYGIVGVLLLLSIYFLPTIISQSKMRRNTGAIFLLNLLLGWTVIFWIVALIWAVSEDKEVVEISSKN